MRHVGAPRWVVVAGCALASYLVVLMVTLPTTLPDPGSEFSTLTRQVTLIIGILVGLPTTALILLLAVRRIARPVAVVASLWLATNAVLWFSVRPDVAAWAMGAAAVVLGAALAGRKRDPVSSSEDGPPS